MVCQLMMYSNCDCWHHHFTRIFIFKPEVTVFHYTDRPLAGKYSIESTYSDFPCDLKVNRGRFALLNRPWKCKKGKDRRSRLVHSGRLAEHDTSPALFPAITVTVVRDRKIRTALRTNQIAGFVTVPSWKKITTFICTVGFKLAPKKQYCDGSAAQYM